MNRDNMLSFASQLREQWQDSRLVRLGVWAGLAIICIYVVLLGFDAVDAGHERNRALEAELSRLQALARETGWPERSREVVGLKAAYDTTVWSDTDLALTEASLQDWLRTVTQRLGLKVREIALVRDEQTAVTVADLPPGYVVLRARVSVELQRTGLFTLLAEMAGQERRIVVERLAIRSQSQPATAEIDLRVLAQPRSRP